MRLSDPACLFLLIGIPYGLTLLFVTPPFQVPDEDAHFLRAYSVSEFQLINKRRPDTAGDFVPASIVQTTWALTADIPQHPERKTSVASIRQELHRPFDPDDRVFVPFINTVLYSPVPYLPQALGMAVARLCRLSPLLMMYCGRLANLLVWLVLVHLAIRLLPAFKWVMLFLALMPMAMFLAASLSPDAPTAAMVFLFIALVLRAGAGDDLPFRRRRFLLAVFVLGLLIALAKNAYAVVPLLLFGAVQPTKLGSRRQYTWAAVLFYASCIAVVLIWSGISATLYVPVPHANPREQLRWILEAPFSHYVLVVLSNLWHHFGTVLDTFVGVLGWLDTSIPAPLIHCYLYAIAFVFLADHDEGHALKVRQRAMMLAAFIAFLLIIYTYQYLTFTPPRSDYIWSVQGRYFIPVAPLLLFALSTNRLRITADDRLARWAPAFVVAIQAAYLGVTVRTLVARYF